MPAAGKGTGQAHDATVSISQEEYDRLRAGLPEIDEEAARAYLKRAAAVAHTQAQVDVLRQGVENALAGREKVVAAYDAKVDEAQAMLERAEAELAALEENG